jgi:flagellar P-ring protein precursor FlgI
VGIEEPKAEARLREIAHLQGVRTNHLLGYGLVVGLNGTGDKDQTKFTVQSLMNLMARQGINIPPASVKVKNIAAVMLTAELPPFARPGQTIDVTVNSTGDASSLAGGTLIMASLQGPDAQTYAVAQGSILVNGFSGPSPNASVTKNHATVGRIPDGAMVEREVPGNFNDHRVLRYSLQEEDFSTAVGVVHAINQELGEYSAKALDSRTVEVAIPDEFQGHLVELVARLENLPIQLQNKARVVVNERTGTVIMGADVKIGAVSIIQGGLSILVTSEPTEPKPTPVKPKAAPAAAGKEAVPAEEDKPKGLSLQPGTSVGKLAEMLNGIGITPRDLVAILQALKDAGALNAELRIL